eukprot:5472302-Prymnesium_polylepis.1
MNPTQYSAIITRIIPRGVRSLCPNDAYHVPNLPSGAVAYEPQVTPQSLLDVQLYSREQYFAWSIGSHRQISIKLSARAIGARELTAEELAVRVADRSSA